jgi:hypothetical protein
MFSLSQSMWSRWIHHQKNHLAFIADFMKIGSLKTCIFMSDTLSECHWSTNNRWRYSIDCWSVIIRPGKQWLHSGKYNAECRCCRASSQWQHYNICRTPVCEGQYHSTSAPNFPVFGKVESRRWRAMSSNPYFTVSSDPVIHESMSYVKLPRPRELGPEVGNYFSGIMWWKNHTESAERKKINNAIHNVQE